MRKKHIRVLTIFSFIFIAISSFGQQLDMPLGRQYNQFYEKDVYKKDQSVFLTSFRPYNSDELFDVVYPDSTFELKRIGIDTKFQKIINVVGYDDILRFDESGFVKATIIDTTQYDYAYTTARNEIREVSRKFYLAANPLLRMEFGYELLRGNLPGQRNSLNDQSDIITYNMRGVELKANIGKKVSIYTAFMENQARFPLLTGIQTRAIQAAPGESKTKNFKGDGFDFATAVGYVSYSPNKFFNVKLGNGKHFIGDGYRSLLLSDNSFTYPHVQFSTKFWKFKYVNIFAELQANVTSDQGFARGVDRKLANFNYLTAEITPWMELGLFEGIVWRRTTPEGNTAFDPNFLNPIIGIRAFQKNLDNKRLYGLNFRFTLPKQIILYGQLAADQLGGFSSANLRGGIQAGVKYFEVAGIKNLNVQLEFNRTRPYTYSGVDSIINFSHYSQPLAHPLGANFNEVLLFVNYRYKRFYGEWKFSWYNQGLNEINPGLLTILNAGSNLFIPQTFFGADENVKTLQGSSLSVLNNEMKAGYIINPKINLAIQGKLQNKFYNFENGFTLKSHIISFGMISNLFNHYYDFTLGPVRF